MSMPIDEPKNALLGELTEFRRDLDAHPELGFQETRTAARPAPSPSWATAPHRTAPSTTSTPRITTSTTTRSASASRYLGPPGPSAALDRSRPRRPVTFVTRRPPPPAPLAVATRGAAPVTWRSGRGPTSPRRSSIASGDPALAKAAGFGRAHGVCA